MTINELKTTIDRFEGDYAVLSYGSGTIEWPKDKLPSGAAEGDVIVLTAQKDADATKSREELARTVINEILKKE